MATNEAREGVTPPENIQFKPSKITVANPQFTLTFIKQRALSEEEDRKASNGIICPSLRRERLSDRYLYEYQKDSCLLLSQGPTERDTLNIAGSFDQKTYGVSLSNVVHFTTDGKNAHKDTISLNSAIESALVARFERQFGLTKDSSGAAIITTPHGFTFALNSFGLYRLSITNTITGEFQFAVSTAKIKQLAVGSNSSYEIADLQDARVKPVTKDNLAQYFDEIALVYDEARKALEDFGINLPPIEAEIISRPKKEPRITDEIRARLGNMGENFIIENPNVRFKDVIGHANILTELKGIINALTDPEAKGELLDLPSGILLYGLPGCGKTYLAKAVATESGCRFLYIQPSMLFDIPEAKDIVRVLFEEIKEQEKPTMIFIDEADTFFRTRGNMLSQPRAEVVSTFLTHLDGIGSSHKAFLVLASNRPDLIDPAMRRSGRINLAIEVQPPTRGERMQLFKYFISLAGDPKLINSRGYNPKLFDSSIFADSEAITQLASRTEKLNEQDTPFTQADIRTIVNVALIRRFNTEEKSPVTLDNLLEIIDELRANRISFQTS